MSDFAAGIPGYPSLEAFFVTEDLKGTQLSPTQKGFLRTLDAVLFEHWNLGKNLVLAYSRKSHALELLVVPFTLPLQVVKRRPHLPNRGLTNDTVHSERGSSSQPLVEHLLSGPITLPVEQLIEASELFGTPPVTVPMPIDLSTAQFPTNAVEDLIKRYSFRYVKNSAVILIDIVGFSLYDALEQATQLNSLIYSINSAHSKMLTKQLSLNFARSTTGDGFYIWNRDSSIESNINLYYLMQLILAENALALSKSTTRETPRVTTAFHIGDHYEFYQAEALRPTIYNYIVGQVTIELARLIAGAKPGQIVVGDFETFLQPPQTHSQFDARFHTIDFIEELQDGLATLHGLTLAGECIEGIKCYLTGQPKSERDFAVTRYLVSDKHGLSHPAYNAKINIYRSDGEPIFLGLQERCAANNAMRRDASI